MNKLALAVLAAFAFSAAAQAAVKDGTYTKTVTGHNAPITVTVEIKGGKIASVTTKDLESPGVGKVAIQKLEDRVIRNQSTRVDVVSGATVTSFQLLGAIKECLKEAGADSKDFAKRVTDADKTPINAETDVVIVGGGGAGLSSAVSALEHGARVVIIEKLGFLGGSTNVCGGALNAAGTKYQKALGIDDNPRKHFEQTMRGGHDVSDPKLVRVLTDNAPDALLWLEGMGLKVNPKVGAATGALFQRSHYPNPAGGHTYVDVLEKQLAKYGDKVKVYLESPATELIVENGRVVGVKANHKGQPITVKAAKGVIVTTGGFGSNVEFRQKVNTGVWKEADLGKEIGCSNISVAAQGQGLMLAEKAGAELIGLSDIQVHPNGSPGTGLMLDIKTSGRNRLFINTNGDRFVNEGAARDVLSKAVFAQPGSTYWLVQNKLRYPDENAIDLLSGRTMRDMLAQGRVQKAKDLDELAKIIKVDPARLKAAVESYNQVARHEVEQDKFGFKATHTDDRPMVEGPWYVARKVPTIHHTMGGIHIDTGAHAVNVRGEVIPGLYAAGEVTGGIHGANRLGGNAVADLMVFGRIAGANAAQAK
jgi:flavocytochrome c